MATSRVAGASAPALFLALALLGLPVVALLVRKQRARHWAIPAAFALAAVGLCAALSVGSAPRAAAMAGPLPFLSPQSPPPYPGCTYPTAITGARVISYTYDPLNRLTSAAYSSGECYRYGYDRTGNRTSLVEATPLSGTLVTTYTYDLANRLATRAVSDGRFYTYTWSARGQMLAEWTQGMPVRTFGYDPAGRLTTATVFTLTTKFRYNGLGQRIAVEVVGRGTTTVTLDTAAGGRILAERTVTGTTTYLYGRDCLGEQKNGEWLYYLSDATGTVRQGADARGAIVSGWRFDPSGRILEGPQGMVLRFTDYVLRTRRKA